MLRQLGLIAICAWIIASVGCDGGKWAAPGPPPPADPNTTATVDFGGRVVDADARGPVGNVRVSVEAVGDGGKPRPPGWRRTLQRVQADHQ